MGISRVFVLLAVASAIVISSAAAAAPVPPSPSMPYCEPGDDCSTPPPGGGGEEAEKAEKAEKAERGGGGGGGGDPVPPPSPSPSAADLYQVAVWENEASAITVAGANPLDPIGSAIAQPEASAGTGQERYDADRVPHRYLHAHGEVDPRTGAVQAQPPGLLVLVEPRITKVGVACFSSDVDSFAIQADPCAIDGYYYTWNGNPAGGHYSLGSGRYANCVLRYGCWRNWVVNVEVWINGNGTWTGRGA